MGFDLKTQFGYGVSGEVNYRAFHYAEGKNWNGDADYASCPSIATALNWIKGMKGVDFSVTTGPKKRRYLAVLRLPSYIVKIRGGNYVSVASELLDSILDELEKARKK